MTFRIFVKRFLLWLLLLTMAAVFLSFLYGIRPVYIKSGSMEPTLPVGSLCLVNTKIEGEEYERGDVIVFVSESMEIAHRLIDTTNQGFRTKGDANNSPDPGLILPENVKGKVIASLPYMGYAAFLCRSPAVAVLLCVIALTVIFRPVAKQRKENIENDR